jgi:hypothetical protein
MLLQAQQAFLAPLLAPGVPDNLVPCTSRSPGTGVNDNGGSAAPSVQDMDRLEAEKGGQYLDTRWRLVQVDSDDIDVASRHDVGYCRFADWLGAPGVHLSFRQTFRRQFAHCFLLALSLIVSRGVSSCTMWCLAYLYSECFASREPLVHPACTGCLSRLTHLRFRSCCRAHYLSRDVNLF